MKSTIVIYGSSTGTCQSIAQTIASKLDAQAVDVASIDEATITSYDNLILGTSTWGAGEMQDDWYDGVKTLKNAGLTGKTVALFGCGDSESYPDTFCGGMKELYDAIRMIVTKPLCQLTPEEDFILGAMLGYDICAQCERFCERKYKAPYGAHPFYTHKYGSSEPLNLLASKFYIAYYSNF
jgi:flavodoxin long chain